MSERMLTTMKVKSKKLNFFLKTPLLSRAPMLAPVTLRCHPLMVDCMLGPFYVAAS